MSKLKFLLAVNLSIAAALFIGGQGQAVIQTDDFMSLPEARRVRLAERLKLFVEYQRKELWDKQYDMFSIRRRRSEGKQDYISFARKAIVKGWTSRLLYFEPRIVKWLKVDAKTRVWIIWGCAGAVENGKKMVKIGSVEAEWENGDWYFSGVQLIGSDESTLELCPPKDADETPALVSFNLP